jgi:hypothetical protein
MLSTIYGLIDPETLAIRYIGRTIQPLSLRLRQHIDFARRKKSLCGRAVWIHSLLAKGIEPEIFAIEQVPLEESPQAEGDWICYFRYIGASLLNEQSHNVGGSKSYVVEWTTEKLDKLGKVSDSELALEFGVDRKSVEYKRKTLGIPRKPQTYFVVPPMGGWNRIELPAHIIDRLGTLPDYILAQEIGTTKKVIAKARKARGIPSFAERTGHPTRYAQGHRPARWDKEHP